METVGKKETEQTIDREKVISNAVKVYLDMAYDYDLGLNNPREEIEKQTLRLIEKFEIDAGFFKSGSGVVRPFLLLGLADKWLSAEDLETQRYIFDYIKIITSNDFLPGNVSRTFSGRQEKMATLGHRQAYEFVGRIFPEESSNNAEWTQKHEFVTNPKNQDVERTESLKRRLDFSNPDSPLKNIREKLGITSETEKKFDIVVLDLDEEQMQKKFNYSIAFTVNGVLCLPNDFEDNLLEHEYIHTQQLKFKFGGSLILGNSLGEAFTEYQTQRPKNYAANREVLEMILSKAPDLEEALRLYGRSPSVRHLDAIVFRLISVVGLDLTLDVLAMSPSGNLDCDDQSYYHGGTFFRPIDDLINDLYGLDRTANEANYEKMINDLRPQIEVDPLIYMISKDVRGEVQEAISGIRSSDSFEDASPAINSFFDLWKANRDEVYPHFEAFFLELINKYPENREQIEDIIMNNLNPKVLDNPIYLDKIINDSFPYLVNIYLDKERSLESEFLSKLFLGIKYRISEQYPERLDILKDFLDSYAKADMDFYTSRLSHTLDRIITNLQSKERDLSFILITTYIFESANFQHISEVFSPTQLDEITTKSKKILEALAKRTNTKVEDLENLQLSSLKDIANKISEKTLKLIHAREQRHRKRNRANL